MTSSAPPTHTEPPKPSPPESAVYMEYYGGELQRFQAAAASSAKEECASDLEPLPLVFFGLTWGGLIRFRKQAHITHHHLRPTTYPPPKNANKPSRVPNPRKLRSFEEPRSLVQGGLTPPPGPSVHHPGWLAATQGPDPSTGTPRARRLRRGAVRFARLADFPCLEWRPTLLCLDRFHPSPRRA